MQPVTVLRVAAHDSPARILQRIEDSPGDEVEAVGLGRAINVLARAMSLATEQSEPLLQVVRVYTSSAENGTAMLSLTFARADSTAPINRPGLSRSTSNPLSSSSTQGQITPQLRRLRSAPSGQMVESQGDLYRQLSAGVVPLTGKALQRLRAHQGLSPVASSVPLPNFGRLVVRFGEDLPEFGCLPAEGGASCGICFEDKKPLMRLCEADEMGSKCGGFCGECVKTYAEQLVQNALHFCPWLRCPTCRRRVPTKIWSDQVEPTIWERYVQNARSLLTVRCRECDGGSTMLVETTADSVTDDEQVFSCFDAEQIDTLRNAWVKCSKAEEPADVLVGTLQDVLKAEDAKRFMRRVFPLVNDLERRLTLQLAWLSKVPQTRTPCCHAKVCFKCKVMGWHPGISCEQKQQKLYMGSSAAVQACPGCGILTQKLDGCDEIACVCGRIWHWESREDGNEEDMRPLLCLASRCMGAGNCIRLLAEHGAPVNEAGEHGSVPLLYAARSLEVDNLRELLSRGADPNCTARASNEAAEASPADATPLSVLLRCVKTLPPRREEKWNQVGQALRELVKAGSKLTHAAFAQLEGLSSPGQWAIIKEALHDAWLVAAAEKPLLSVVNSITFEDTDGDVIMIKREGSHIKQYVNGKLEISHLIFMRIDKEARTYRDNEGSGTFKPEEDLDNIISLRDRLFWPEVPLWTRVLWDTPDAVKQALAGANANSVDVVVLASVARRLLVSGGTEWAECQEIANILKGHSELSEESWEELKKAAATYILLVELRSAIEQEREPEVAVVKVALDRGADPNGLLEDDDDYSENKPVHMLTENAWSNGASSLETLELLVEARADVNAKRAFSYDTPIQMATLQKHCAMAEVLLKHGAGSSVPDLYALVGSSSAALLQMITPQWSEILAGLMSKWPEKKGSPPLWALVRTGNIEAVKSYLEEMKNHKEPTQDLLEEPGSGADGLHASPSTPLDTPPSTPVTPRVQSADVEIAGGLLRCRRDHPLRPLKRPRNMCNLCDKTGTAYRCSNGCNWDACQECWDLCSDQLEEANPSETQITEDDSAPQLAILPESLDDMGEEARANPVLHPQLSILPESPDNWGEKQDRTLENEIKKGDKVRLVKEPSATGILEPGQIGEVDRLDSSSYPILVKNDNGSTWWYREADVEKVDDKENAPLTDAEWMLLPSTVANYVSFAELKPNAIFEGIGWTAKGRAEEDPKQTDIEDPAAHTELGGHLEEGVGAHAEYNASGSWDQFNANKEQFGIVSTYSDDLYTTKLEFYNTKLDPNTISREKRDEAPLPQSSGEYEEILAGAQAANKDDPEAEQTDDSSSSSIETGRTWCSEVIKERWSEDTVPQAIIGLLCMRQPEMRPEMESCLHEYVDDEKFATLLQVATMLVMRADINDAFEQKRPINEKVVLDLVEQGAHLGAPEDFAPFQQHGSHFYEDRADLCTLSLLIEECDEYQPIDCFQRVFQKVAEKYTDAEPPSVVDDMLANWLESRWYRFLPACLLSLPDKHRTITRETCDTHLKKLSVAASSREIQAALAPMVVAWQARIDEKDENEAVTEAWNLPPLWVLTRFGLWRSLQQRLSAEGPAPTEAEFADIAVAFLQVKIQSPDLHEQVSEVLQCILVDIEKLLTEKAGEDMWQQYAQVAHTTAMVYEIQEALAQERAPDEALVKHLLAHGADARALGRASGGATEDLSDFDGDDMDYEDDEDEDAEEEGGESEQVPTEEASQGSSDEEYEDEEGEEEEEEDSPSPPGQFDHID